MKLKIKSLILLFLNLVNFYQKHVNHEFLVKFKELKGHIFFFFEIRKSHLFSVSLTLFNLSVGYLTIEQ